MATMQTVSTLNKIEEARRKRKILWTIALGVVALHVLVLVVFGSVIIFQHVFKRDVTFEAPPEVMKKLEPRKLEHKVKVQKQQQKSGRPKTQPRLSANKITDFALPDIKVDPEKVKDPLKSNVRSFGASGVGTGTMGGQGMGGLGLGTSQVMMFGIKANVERIAVLIDLSPSMVEDEKGGIEGFAALKREIKDVIRTLNEGSFFNLIAFDSSIDIFNADAVLANRKNKNEGAEWMDPYMSSGTTMQGNGTLLRNYRPKDGTPTLPNTGGETRFDLALSAAMESGVDTIFIISDGVHHIRRVPSPQQEKEWADLRANETFMKNLQRQQDSFNEMIRKEAEDRAKRGLPPRIVEARGAPDLVPDIFDDASLFDYVKTLGKALYTDKGKKPPRIYVIGYVTTPKDERFLRMLAQRNNGTFRRTKTLSKPITDKTTGAGPGAAGLKVDE